MPLAGALCYCCSCGVIATSVCSRWSSRCFTFGLSLHLPVHFHRMLPGFQYEVDKQWITTPEHPLPHGRGWDLDVAGAADHVSHSVVRV